MDDSHDLELLIRSSTPLIVVETHEEPRLVDLLAPLALRAAKPLFRWSISGGIQRCDLDSTPQGHTREPEQALQQILATRKPGLYMLADLHPYLDNPAVVRLLKEIALGMGEAHHTLVLVSHRLELPAELRAFASTMELSLPDTEQLHDLVRRIATEWSRESGSRVRTDRETLDRLVANLRGLTVTDARRLIRGAIRDDSAITEDDLPQVQRARYRLLERTGALSFEFDVERFESVAGLRGLKRWLRHREPVMRGEDENLDPPRGVLLVGVQGAGKSLAARAVAGSWGLVLLRLDVGSLYDRYYGESERNLRDSLNAAEALSPCVLWIDEIEKAVSADGDDDLSRRMLGTLLTWMAERRSRVFVVATANAIERLPPELVRKGRFDEIFFVDLPTPEVRAEIFRIHLTARDKDASRMDLERLAAASDGFSGAEIEQAVVSALYRCRAERTTLGQAHIEAELSRTRPLSVVMGERIDGLRRWAAGRTVPADD